MTEATPLTESEWMELNECCTKAMFQRLCEALRSPEDRTPYEERAKAVWSRLDLYGTKDRVALLALEFEAVRFHEHRIPSPASPLHALTAACNSAHKYPHEAGSKPCSWPACELSCKGREHRLSAGAAMRVENIQDRLERGCAEIYQVVGILADDAGRFDDPQVMKALDWLADPTAADCDLLPFKSTPSPTPGAAMARAREWFQARIKDDFGAISEYDDIFDVNALAALLERTAAETRERDAEFVYMHMQGQPSSCSSMAKWMRDTIRSEGQTHTNPHDGFGN